MTKVSFKVQHDPDTFEPQGNQFENNNKKTHICLSIHSIGWSAENQSVNLTGSSLV